MNIDTREPQSIAHRHPPRAGLAPAMLLLVLMAAAAPFAIAQDEAPAEDAAPPAAVEPAPGILLNFQDAPLSAVLDHLSEAAGLVIVQETSVQGRVSILARQPVSVEEAVSLLNTVLKEQGYAAIRTGRTLKIVMLSEAKEHSIAVRSGNDPEQIEPTDEMITQVIPIRFADAVKLRDDISSLVPSYAAMSANASSNSLILTDTGANVRRIVEIVRALDTHMAAIAEVKVFTLQYADATAVARLINEVFQQEEQPTRGAQTRSTRFRGMSFGRGGGDRPEEEGQGARGQKVIAAADERTNTLVVSGPADVMKVIEQVVEDLDSNPAEEEGVFVYKLKNAGAANMATLLNDLFSEQADTQLRTSTGRGGRRMNPFQRMAQASQATSQAVGALSGEVHVVADEDTQSLLILTAPGNFERVSAIIEELDRAIPQVLIKVLIAEVTHDREVDLGVEFSVLNLAEGERGSALFTDFGVADATEGLIYRLVRGDASAAIRALETVGKLEILSRPYILASDNQEATITVGQEVPFVRATRTTETGQTINTIEYEDVGIILKVTPHINPEGLVIMDVSPEISAVTDSTVPISETLDATIINKRSAQTRVAIRDGQTIVIGGLMEDRKTETVKKVPILGSIPLLGALFRRTIEDKGKTELLIFLTPHVAPEADLLKAMSEDEMRGVRVVPDAVEPGAFDAHMQGMQLGGAKAQEEE